MGIYLHHADSPDGPWSRAETIFNPFDEETFGYCELMYFADPHDTLDESSETWEILERDCALEEGVKTLTLNDLATIGAARTLFFGAEYGAAVLPPFVASASGGGVSFHWLLSTWIPYRVVVMRTEFDPFP